MPLLQLDLRQVPGKTRNPGSTRMLMSHEGTSHGTVTSRGSHDSHVDESLTALSYEPDVDESRVTAGTSRALVPVPQLPVQANSPLRTGSAACGPRSPYLRGTRCGVQNSAELWNVSRAHVATGQAQAAPIYRPGAQVCNG